MDYTTSIHEFTFYSMASTSNKTIVETALYEDLFCVMERVTNRGRSEQEQRGAVIEEFVLFPSEILEGVEYGTNVVNSESRFLVQFVEVLDDHQEITIKKVENA